MKNIFLAFIVLYISPCFSQWYKKSIGLIKSGNEYEVCIDDEIEARFKTKEKAENYILFLKGERNKIWNFTFSLDLFQGLSRTLN